MISCILPMRVTNLINVSSSNMDNLLTSCNNTNNINCYNSDDKNNNTGDNINNFLDVIFNNASKRDDEVTLRFEDGLFKKNPNECFFCFCISKVKVANRKFYRLIHQ